MVGVLNVEERQSGQGSVVADNLNVNTIWDDLAFLLELVVVGLDQLGETELSGDEDLLSAGELELGSSQGLLGVVHVINGASHGHEDLTDLDTSGLAKSLSESASHTLLESIGTSAREHLVDSNNVPRVNSDSHMEVLSTNVLLHVLVTGDSGGLKSFGGDLLLLVANQMDASGEDVVSGLLLTDIVDSELGIGDTSVESGLGVGLVLLVPVALDGLLLTDIVDSELGIGD
eukprot:CAMPEP_0170479396 /NCGR_PEP_ID=MMETSP0208-20121228/645_1 /TAXON_ID=197538 /ORGANISM="Strombidium inclinatum, Strain S3" /LENGTH=230 /DNA_ID=CAMNT_0010751787 /DNA_START=52 /DNA_END=743 /DNA_ORIENTATION=-